MLFITTSPSPFSPSPRWAKWSRKRPLIFFYKIGVLMRLDISRNDSYSLSQKSQISLLFSATPKGTRNSSYKRMLYHKISPLINFCHFREPRSGERFPLSFSTNFHTVYKINQIFLIFLSQNIGEK